MTTATATTTTFRVGETVATRSACDHDCIFRFTVIARTARFVTLDDGHDTYRVGIKTWDGYEYALPFGSYSMAPLVYAGRDIEVAA